MLYVLARTVPEARSLAAEVGSPAPRDFVPITPRNVWTAIRGRELKRGDTVLIQAGTGYPTDLMNTELAVAATRLPMHWTTLAVEELDLR